VFDPATNQPRTFNDLGRRNADLKAIVCPNSAVAAGTPQTSLRKGVSRVH
jgi:hypothetical protein